MQRFLAVLLMAALDETTTPRRTTARSVVFVCEHGSVRDGIPPVTERYPAARDAMKARIEALLATLELPGRP